MTISALEILSLHRCFEGTLGYYIHWSKATNCRMRFSLFTPPQTKKEKCPALFFLSGLTCTEENFTVKAGAYKLAAELGLCIIVSDTSPRGSDVPTDDVQGIGKGAGFYVDATEEPWSCHYRMESYITQELRELVLQTFPIDPAKLSIFGHSMGGHGALSLYLRHPGLYRSVSAFAPVCSAMESPLGQKAFRAYLGPDKILWTKYDATQQMLASTPTDNSPVILIDQGTEDAFLHTSLKSHLFEAACRQRGQKLTLRMQKGYDHSYFFVQTFIEDHLRHHAGYLL